MKNETFHVPPVQIPQLVEDTHPPKSAHVLPSLTEMIKNTPFMKMPEMIKVIGTMYN